MLDNHDIIRQVVQSVDIGVAVVAAGTWAVTFENAKFFQWFPPGGDADEPLPKRVPGLRQDRAATRVQAGRVYSFETEASVGARTIPLGRHHQSGGADRRGRPDQ